MPLQKTGVVGLPATFLEPYAPTAQVVSPAAPLAFVPVAHRAIPRALFAPRPRTVSTAAFAAAPAVVTAKPKPRAIPPLRRRQSAVQPLDLGVTWLAIRPKRLTPQLRRGRAPVVPPPVAVVPPPPWPPTPRRTSPRWLQRTRPSQPCPWALPTIAVFPIVLVPRCARRPMLPITVRRRSLAIPVDRLQAPIQPRVRRSFPPRRRAAFAFPSFMQALPPALVAPQRGRKAPSWRRIAHSQYSAWTPGSAPLALTNPLPPAVVAKLLAAGRATLGLGGGRDRGSPTEGRGMTVVGGRDRTAGGEGRDTTKPQ